MAPRIFVLISIYCFFKSRRYVVEQKINLSIQVNIINCGTIEKFLGIANQTELS